MTAREWPPRPGELPADSQYVELFGGAIRCWQPNHGYRFSVDAFLLAMAAGDCEGRSVLELGTGVGVVLLALAAEPQFGRLVGIEIQRELAAYAQANVCLNQLGGRVEIVEGDLRAPPESLSQERFDLVVSNPPYFPVGEGHLSRDSQKAIARHEVACRLADVFVRTQAALATGGVAVIVYPAQRVETAIDEAVRAGLTVTDVRPIRSREACPTRQALLHLRRDPHAASAPTSPRTHPPLDIHGLDGAHVGPLADFFERLERLARPGRSRRALRTSTPAGERCGECPNRLRKRRFAPGA